jgi:hypothetical protein
MKDARNALDMIKQDLIPEKIGLETYWLSNLFNTKRIEQQSIHLLPAFDEFVISYKDRSALMPKINLKKAVSDNGVFRPVILIDGQAAGLWNRIIKKDKVIIGIDYFQPQPKMNQNLFEKVVKTYGKFLGKAAEIIDNKS